MNRYCARRHVPYAFRHFPLEGLPPGFPVWFDINLSQEGAETWRTWLSEGLLLDDHTRGLLARLVTYNPDLGVWAEIEVAFEFEDSGSIQVGEGARCGTWYAAVSWG